MPSFSGIKNSRMLIFEDIASYDENFEKDWHFIWSKYLNSQVSSVTLIFRLLYQLSKIEKKYTKLTYITC